MTISLGRELPHTSCSLPEAANLAVQVTSSHLLKGLPLLDLAPGGGYLAVDIAAYAGGLLHHLFTLALSCPSPKPCGFGGGWKGRSVSVVQSVRLPRPGCYPAPCFMECGLSSMARSHRGHPVSLGNFIIP
jgi:hypothetical protein